MNVHVGPPAPIDIFDITGEPTVSPVHQRRIRRRVIIGCIFTCVFVFGLMGWAAVSTVTGAVAAPGVVKVENNRKSVKHLEPGIVRQILVHEGEHVKRGQLLFVFDDAQPKSQLQELENEYDALLAQRARFEAELLHKPAIDFPPEVLADRSDPAVAAMIQDQQSVFASHREVLATQANISQQRVAELGTQISGLRSQVASTDSQSALNEDELQGLQTLYKGGYAPKTRVLDLQRSAAQLTGSKGEQVAEIARAQQSIGETRVQLIQTQQQFVADAADGLRDVQEKISDVQPRLDAAREVLAHTTVLSPVDGYVLNQTQFTEGGVVSAGESMLDIVPDNVPLVVEAKIKPRDVHAVAPGMKALVTLTAYNARTTPKVEAVVDTVAADELIDQKSGQGYFTAQLRIEPNELKRLPPDVKLYPGLPTQTMIVTGHRTIMDFLIGPLRDAITQSMHEQ